MKTLNVFSPFDGISVAQQALKELRIKGNYYASETDEYAISIAQRNHPKTVQLGDIRQIKGLWGGKIAGGNRVITTGKIDLMIGGSPCQDLSIAGKRKGLTGERSGLFWEYVRLLKEIKPRYFILENVASMPQEAKDEISKALGVEPIMINASLVSAQNRKRLFWTNIPGVTQPKDRNIMLKDVLEDGVNEIYQLARGNNKGGIKVGKAPTMNASKYQDNNKPVRIGTIGKGCQGDRIYSPDGKSINLSSTTGGKGGKTGLYAIPTKSKTVRTAPKGGGIKDRHNWENITDVRKLTPVECERLQCLPDGYTAGVSNNQRYKALGNAFNKEVVKHIISFIPKKHD